MMLSQSGAAAPPTAPEAAPVAAAPPAGDPTIPRSDVVGSALPTNSLPASTELLSYYRQRIQEFEAERSEFIKRISEIEVSHEELHRTQWDLRVRHEEIAELQRALSDANVYLFDEREQVLKLQAENDQLKIQELEDRRRIQHLLALTQPVSQEVTFFRDCRPAKMTRFPVENTADNLRGQVDRIVKGDSASSSQVGASAATKREKTPGAISGGRRSRRPGSSMASTAASLARSRAVAAASGKSGASSSSSKLGASALASSAGATHPYKNRVLRTIYLPSEKADTLLLTVESLQKQLVGVKELEAERNSALLEDRRRRVEEERNRASGDREEIERLQECVRVAEEKTRQVTQTYLEQRHGARVAARVAKEEIEMLRSQNQRIMTQLQEERRRFSMEIQSVRNAAEQEAQVYTEQFRREALAREEDLSVLKEQYAGVQQMSQAKIKDLESRLTNLTRKHRQLEQRRSMDFEGFNNDIISLKKHVRFLEQALANGSGGRRGRGRRGGKRKGGASKRRPLAISNSSVHSFLGKSEDISSISRHDSSQPDRLQNHLQQIRDQLASLEGQIDGYVEPPAAQVEANDA